MAKPAKVNSDSTMALRGRKVAIAARRRAHARCAPSGGTSSTVPVCRADIDSIFHRLRGIGHSLDAPWGAGVTAGLDRPTSAAQRAAMVFPNPSITGTAIVKALDHDQATAHHRDADDAQAALDEAELREEERADYYGDPSTPKRPRASRIAAGSIDSCAASATARSTPPTGVGPVRVAPRFRTPLERELAAAD